MTALVCPHGDPCCPCQDGDLCHYEYDPFTDTAAMLCTNPTCEKCAERTA